MKKLPKHWILFFLAVIVFLLAVVSGLRAMKNLEETKEKMDQSYLDTMEQNQALADEQQKQEEERKEKRQEALDRKKESEKEETQQGEDSQEEESEEAGEEETENSFKNAQEASNGHKVGIDAGHQGSWVDMSALEANAPGSSTMKARCTTGTTGNYTGLEEYQLNLNVSLKLRDILVSRGYEVVMTREDNDANISNSERAQLMTQEGAEICVRVHANSSTDTSVSGALTMCPSSSNPYVGSLYDDCYRLAQAVLDSYCSATGIGNRGISITDDMTGFNWSTIPVTIIEMGFMSNQSDDTTMADEEFQEVMAEGIANGIDVYFSQQ
jgi:N-acetylmuramoyl-L-alanine amidase